MIDASDILTVTKAVTAEWTKQRKAEERGNRSKSSRQHLYVDHVKFSDVTDLVIPAAYDHASGGGRYTVSKRQLYYACREEFRNHTGRVLEYEYFANTLVVQFLNRNPVLTNTWKITADPRGTLVVPNAGHDVRVPCGTLQIDQHLRRAMQSVGTFDIASELPVEWPSLAEGQRYQAVLYIEKEGFEPLLKEARIAERFDLALLSCKGQSVVAARKYVDWACRKNGGVPLLVVHDFDKSGFEISQRLTRVSEWAEAHDRVTYQFENEINVIDLGLRLADVEQYDLQTESVEFTGNFASDSICTPEEQAFLRSDRRVELNAFTSPQFVQWLESQLRMHLPLRLIPAEELLETAYRRAVVVAAFNSAIKAIEGDAIAKAKAATIPDSLRRDLELVMSESKEPWDRALYSMVVGGEGLPS